MKIYLKIILLSIIFSPAKILYSAGAPATISDLTALTSSSDGELTLEWTAPGADGLQGTATGYILHYSTTANIDDESGFLSSTTYYQNWPPQSAGAPESETVTGLFSSTTYYWAIKAYTTGLGTSTWSRSGGINQLNYKWVTDYIHPNAISDLFAQPGSNDGEINISWTAPGDDASTGEVSEYIVKCGTNDITSANFSDSATYYHTWSSFSEGGLAESRTLTGLNPGTTYYIAIKAKDDLDNLSSWSTNAANTFRSAPAKDSPPPAPTNLSATSADKQITLSWTDVTGKTDLYEYKIYRDSTNPYDFANELLLDTTPHGFTTYIDTGLNNGATYAYRITLTDTGDQGNGLYSIVLESDYSNSDTAIPKDTTPPDAVTNLSALSGTQEGKIDLSWTSPGDDGITGDLTGGFRIDYSSNPDYSFQSSVYKTDLSTTSQPPSTTQIHTLTGLFPAATYYIRIWSYDEEINLSDSSNGATVQAKNDPPSPPGNPAVTDATKIGNTLNISWEANSEPDFISYRLYRSSYSCSPGSKDLITTILPPGTTHQDTYALDDNTTYFYQITSVDFGDSESSPTSEVYEYPRDTEAPGQVTNLTATALSAGNTIQLDWDTVSDIDVAGYRIYRSTTNGQTGILQASTPTTTYIDGSLNSDKTYYYQVSAIDEVPNEGTLSTQVNETPKDCIPPSAITNLSAITGSNNGEVTLTWTAPGDDDTQGTANDYIVKYASYAITNQTIFDKETTYPQSWTPKTQGETETYTLTGLTAGTTLFFNIESKDESGNQSTVSNPEATATVNNDITAPSAISISFGTILETSIQILWTSTGDDGSVGQAESYDVRYTPLGAIDTEAKFTAATQATGEPAPSVSGQPEAFTITGLSAGTTYFFAAKIVDEAGNASALSNSIGSRTLDDVNPAAPAGLTAQSKNSQVYLTWTSNSENDLSGYNIYRSTSTGGPYSKINSTITTINHYTDTGLTNTVKYYYAITAEDTSGNESAYSTEVNATPASSSPPMPPTGIEGESDTSGNFTITWNAVSLREDESDLNNLKGYRILSSPSLSYTFSEEVFISSSNPRIWTKTAAETEYYYTIRTVDAEENESRNSAIISGDLSLTTQYNSGELSVKIPKEATTLFNKNTNGLGEDIRIDITRDQNSETGSVLRSYSIKPVLSDQNEAMDSFKLTGSDTLELTFKLSELKSSPKNISGAPGINRSAAVYYFDRVTWVKLGGTVDTARGTIIIKTQKFGSFQVRQTPQATRFAISQIIPKRIFTPNNDGIWDEIEFFFENPNSITITETKVINIRGAKVCDMALSASGNSYVWDGKDEDGEIVPSGIYIYQIKAGGEVINGTMVVAR